MNPLVVIGCIGWAASRMGAVKVTPNQRKGYTLAHWDELLAKAPNVEKLSPERRKKWNEALAMFKRLYGMPSRPAAVTAVHHFAKSKLAKDAVKWEASAWGHFIVNVLGSIDQKIQEDPSRAPAPKEEGAP